MIIDAWMQHPNADRIDRSNVLAEMDEAGVNRGMPCAW
jgi:hypothetical protein